MFSLGTQASRKVGDILTRAITTRAHQTQQGYGKYILAGALAAAGVVGFWSTSNADDALPPVQLPWPHNGHFTAYDHFALRRGWQVYKEVCSACHSLRLVYWRHLVGVVGTEDEVKEWASEHEYQDGPDENGEMFTRPGKLTDRMPLVYENETQARLGNGGSLPPDLSLMKKARHAGDDYIFSLLTGYRDAPHGLNLREGLHYNPYFPGAAIGMSQVLFEDMVEYEDGTPATISQMAKDVTTFLSWTAEPEHDERKKLGWKVVATIGLMIVPTLYWKRFKFSVIKTRQVKFSKLPDRFY